MKRINAVFRKGFALGIVALLMLFAAMPAKLLAATAPGPIAPPAGLWQPASGATPASGNYVYIESSAGDYIGGGHTYTYTGANATFGFSGTGSLVHVNVTGNQNWAGDFKGRDSLAELQVGYYGDLRRYPFHDPAQGGMNWSGDGRGCNTLSGWFVVDNITYDSGKLSAVDLRFEQFCGGSTGALHGQIHWTATDTTVPPGPVNPPPADLWKPVPGAVPATGNVVYLESTAGDYIGLGQTYLYTAPSSPISVTSGGGHVAVALSSWNGDFKAMNTLTELQQGYYPGLQRYPFNNPALGGLNWSGNGRGCNTLSGWFAIDNILYIEGKVAYIDLRFEQHCEMGTSALRGQVRWMDSNVKPTCSLTASPGSIALTESSTLTATCILAATSYDWKNAGIATTAASGVVSPATTTTYAVTGSNANGAGNSAMTIVTVRQTPVCKLTASPSVVSKGGSTYLFASCNSPASSYVWTNTGTDVDSAGVGVSPSATTTYSVAGVNASGIGASTSITVPVGAGPVAAVQALFVNASTSAGKTTVLRLVNTSPATATITATAFDENGNPLGTANSTVAAIAGNASKVINSASLESLLGFVPSSPTAKYSVYFYSNLTGLQLLNFARDATTGALTLAQSQYADRSSLVNAAASVVRTAWFVSAASSPAKTNVIRLINTSTQAGTLTATAFDEAGNLTGLANTPLGTINARQMLTYSSAMLEAALGINLASPSAKYRVIFTANVPSLELVNSSKDPSGDNLTLAQSQIDDRAANAASTSTRNALQVIRSNDPARTTALRIVNPNAATASFTAIAYGESGAQIGNGTLGTAGPNQTLALESNQIEALLHISPGATGSGYRLLVSADVPTFEVLAHAKERSTGALSLSQAQTDNRVLDTAAASATVRHALLIYPAKGSAYTSELVIVNPSAKSGMLTATAYDDNGILIGLNQTVGTLAANQTLKLTSAQLEKLFGNRPAAGSSWRVVFTAILPNLEVVNYAKDVSGNRILMQAQTE